jgi:hypothetical protein
MHRLAAEARALTTGRSYGEAHRNMLLEIIANNTTAQPTDEI